MTLKYLLDILGNYSAFFVYDNVSKEKFDSITLSDGKIIMHSLSDVSDDIYFNPHSEITCGEVVDDSYRFLVVSTKNIQHELFLQVRICPIELIQTL